MSRNGEEGTGTLTDSSIRLVAHEPAGAARPSRAIDEALASALDMDSFTPRLLHLLSTTFALRESETLRQELELGSTDWRILAGVASSPGLSATEISAATVMSKAAISRSLSVLVERELVVQGDGPRGSRPLRLTPLGAATYERMLPIALRAQRLVERSLSVDEVKQFNAMLRRLIAATNAPENWVD